MIKKQAGLTMISWILILGLVATQVVMAIRIVPVYSNHQTLVSIMDELATDSQMRGATTKKIHTLLKKRLNINSLYDLERDKEAFTFKKTSDGYILIAKYEARGPIFKNLEFAAKFEHQVEIRTR